MRYDGFEDWLVSWFLIVLMAGASLGFGWFMFACFFGGTPWGGVVILPFEALFIWGSFVSFTCRGSY